MPANFRDIQSLADIDVQKLKKAEKSYGDSWRDRGGVGAFMMLARKWDRIENQVKKDGWDIFHTISQDSSDTGILDDIRDLRRYLLLVESYTTKNRLVKGEEEPTEPMFPDQPEFPSTRKEN
tara:strand:- start:4478 stop:4843 length:366 start_codon:yes stop_codon:yes gene_type:complete